jgi:hexulose-6-phosphate isomerase
MKTSLNVSLFDPDVSIEEAITQAAQASFDAIELNLSSSALLTFESTEADCVRIAKLAGRAGLEISGLTTGGGCETNLGSPDPAQRDEARRKIVAALDRATWLGTERVIFAPTVIDGPALAGSAPRYEDAHALVVEALLGLRFEAERRAVCLACLNCCNGFLVSQVEMRDFVDEINSYWLGVCLDLGAKAGFGCAEDWIRTLGHRLRCVHFRDAAPHALVPGATGPVCAGAPDWAGVMQVLKEIRHEGPATFHGRGTAVDAAERLGRIVRCEG